MILQGGLAILLRSYRKRRIAKTKIVQVRSQLARYAAQQAFDSMLDDRERLILERRILSEPTATLRVIAKQLDISYERVRQIETFVADKLNRYLIDKKVNLL